MTTLIQVLIKHSSKRSTDDSLTMPELGVRGKHRLESYWSKYHEQLAPTSDFHTCRQCIQKKIQILVTIVICPDT